MADNQVFDLTIVGGGPAGLYGLYHAGMRGMTAKVIDSLEQLGGQLMAMYPEKYIYDVAGFPKVLARELVENLVEQGLQNDPAVCLGERVEDLQQLPDGTFKLVTDKGEHLSRTVVLTVGIGAFQPRRMEGVPNSIRLEGRGVSYFVTDLKRLHGKRILIVGGGDSAVDWANMLAEHADVTVIHRRGEFRAHEASVEKMLGSSAKVLTFHELKDVHGDDHVTGATVYDNRTNEEQTLDVDEVILSLGFIANLGPIRDWGIEFEGKKIKVNSEMETNVPGVYAAGDCTTFPGKIDLIATGFGEVAIAVNKAKTYIDPKAKLFAGHSTSRGF